MLDDWDKDNELFLLEEQVQPLLPSPIVPLVAILVELLPGCSTENDEKDRPVLRRHVNERISIWALLTNSERRKAGFHEVSCASLYLVL